MISVAIAGENIDLSQSASFTIGARSPYTVPGELYGPKVYNIAALDSRLNNKVFQFSKLLNNTSRVRTYPDAEIRFADLLWKVGTLKLRDYTGAYNFSFHTDAGDIETRIQNRKLTDLDLGEVPATFNTTNIYPAANYAHFTVKNPTFYTPEASPDYVGYVNLYDQANDRLYNPTDDGINYAVTPFPFLLFVLDQVFRDLGYFGIEGNWTAEEAIKRVVIYNNYDQRGGNMAYSSHLPPVSIGSFLIDTAIMFGITYVVNPLTRKVSIQRISDWLNDAAYTDLNHRANEGYKLEPNESDGFLFRMLADSEDKSLDTLPGWMESRTGSGASVTDVQASPLRMLSETNPYGGQWDIPYVEQAGSGPALDMEPESRGGLRFMFFEGMSTDSLGNDYPVGHYLRAGMSLRWDGADGILARCYTEWMDWKSYTEYTERTVELSLVELLQLDTSRKVMIDNLKWVVDEYEASINTDGRADRIKTSLKLYSVKL
jgi:hypothetical protein